MDVCWNAEKDTPQFQRLRDLKQLGVTHFIFPGASHHRFEHSIGVSVLANRVITGLKFRQPELGVSERDIKCVTLAGLCHDLGHGPFSHAFEEWLHRRAEGQTMYGGAGEGEDRKREDSGGAKEGEKGANGEREEIGERGAYKEGERRRKARGMANPLMANFSHEEMSLKIIDFMIDENSIDIEREDVRFVQSLIAGEPFVGAKNEREEGRMWMYDIVANKRNSIDVDKWDYLARDCYGLGIKSSYDHSRLMSYSRVIDNEICYHAKEAYNIYEMFHTRYSLFKQVYSHRVGKSIEFMIGDAFDLADEELGISDAIFDVSRYSSFLTDNLLRTIESSRSPSLKPARDIISRIRRRDLYKMADEVLLKADHASFFHANITPDALSSASHRIFSLQKLQIHDPFSSSLLFNAKDSDPSSTLPSSPRTDDGTTLSSSQNTTLPHLLRPSSANTPLTPNLSTTEPDFTCLGPLPSSSFRVNSFTCNYAHKDKNPVDSVHFFSKWDDTVSFKLEKEDVSLLIPSTFSERYLRVYVTDSLQIPLGQRSFRHLYAQLGGSQPGPQHTISRTVTPALISSSSSSGLSGKRRSNSKGAIDSPSPSKKPKEMN